MGAPVPARCYSCGVPVSIFPTEGGRGSGDLTSYGLECRCGVKVNYLGSDGTMRSAIREWNAICKEKLKGAKP